MSSTVEEKMESEQSYSGGSSSSSGSCSGSSEAEEEAMEAVRILGHTLELPVELCEDYSVFKEFFSKKTWDSLEDEHRDHLKTFLPTFKVNDEAEKDKTLKMLFNYENFYFTSPLNDFYNNLKQGNYRPDIAKMRKFLKKARTKQQKHLRKTYYAKLLPEVLLSRERLLESLLGAPPGPVPRLPSLPPKPSSKNNFKPLHLRAKQRYFEELLAIRSEVGGEESDDDNYPEGPPQQFSRKNKNLPGQSHDSNISGTLGSSDTSHATSLECLKNALAAHRTRRQYRENHPELDTTGITLEDIKQRVAVLNGAKKLMFGGTKSELSAKLKRGPKTKDLSKLKTSEGKSIKKKEDESVDTKPLLPNIKIKCEQEETDSENSSFVDPVSSPKQSRKLFDQVEVKQEVEMKYPNVNFNYNDPKLESIIKQEPQDLMAMQGSSKMLQPVPIKLEDLDGIDMMALPIEIADDSGDVLPVDTSTETTDDIVDPDESLTETTYGNFLALVRALFPARAAHRASKQQLHLRCAAVLRSPIAPLNTWYSMSENWCSELDSALDFLAGVRGPHPDDFVPYLQFMPETQMYQWIGAGRDCDAILGRLCERWLRSCSPTPPNSEAPPPKYPTSWSVRPPTSAEIAEFRAQERKRFATATKPFTYVQFGYRSVVGSCGRTDSGSTVTGVSGLAPGPRPRAASLPALLRDAVARLPNGEGTRHHILTLLKMSQWIAQCPDQTLLGIISPLLDKMHSAKRDPFVKYDQRTAIWTYLHRHKSEEDWMTRNRRAKPVPLPTPAPVSIPVPNPAPVPNPTPASSSTILKETIKEASRFTPPHAMDMEIASIEEVIDNGSDTDVDVDDTGSHSTSSQLSSAQLLIQATQIQPQTKLPFKPKGKLVPVSPQKAKTIINKHLQNQVKANLMAQSVKQANINQAAKQALTAQVAKTNLLQTQIPAKTTVPTITKQTNIQSPKQTPQQIQKPQTIVSQPKQSIIIPATSKQTIITPQVSKPNIVQTKSTIQIPKSNLMAQSAKQACTIAQLTKPAPKPTIQKQVNIIKQTGISPKHKDQKTIQPVKTPSTITPISKSEMPKIIHTPPAKSLPVVVPAPNKSQLLKQRPLQKQIEISHTQTTTQTIICQQPTQSPTLIQPIVSAALPVQSQNKPVIQTTRSLLIRPPNAQSTVPTIVSTPTQVTTLPSAQRRGVVRVLSPANPTTGKSLISPRALLQQGLPTAKKRVDSPSVTAVAQSSTNVTTVVSSVQTAVTSSVTRTVQLAGGRTVQLAANQTVHLPGGQSVQLSGHTLQLSSLQLPTHSVRLPSGQTVQLATPQTMQAIRAQTPIKPSSPRPQSSPKPQTSVQIPISSYQLAGQTVQIAGQTVQLTGQSVQIGGQSVQLTGHTVKLPSGQSVQVASQSVLSSQSVQLPSGQTVQIANANVQMPSGQSVQLGGQTVQLGGQTVQIGGQTVQLPSGQTVQLSSGQTLQLASGQTVQLANQAQKTVTQVVRNVNQAGAEKGQPIVAKLLTNAQGQMISLEGAVGNARALQMSGVRVLSPAARMTRPLLLTTAKPLHNIILQSDGSAIRVTSTGAAPTSQTIVFSNIGAQSITTSTTTTPVLKLQQMNPLQQVKLAQGIKLQQAGASSSVPTSTVRSVLMDGQQLKLVGGRHVLARILRPANPHPQ